MNGAELLVRTLIDEGVDVCFTNPGTSEMHFVAALDKVDGLRCVLGLHETVVTGAADGYFRITGRPAATLLHLGPGLCNGLANLHNARKARSGIINIVGDHTAAHLALDAPLTSDLPAIAGSMSDSVRYLASDTLVEGGREAVRRSSSRIGGIATVVLPADIAWTKAPEAVFASPEPLADRVSMAMPARDIARTMQDDPRPTLILMGSTALRADCTRVAAKIAGKTGVSLRAEYFVARMERGAGRAHVPRLPYAAEAAEAVLAPFSRIILVNARAPVAFFAYPHRDGQLLAKGCDILTLSEVEDDPYTALQQLADALGALSVEPVLLPPATGELPAEDVLSSESIGRAIALTLPENAIVVDESVTTGWRLDAMTADARPHDWLTSCGGAIGFALPTALGAAIAAPGRRVLALEGDGSGMYSLQALWSIARENLDVTTVIFVNRAYAILRRELTAVGVTSPGERAIDMLSLTRPDLDWCALSQGMGLRAVRVGGLRQLRQALEESFSTPGPRLIEVLM